MSDLDTTSKRRSSAQLMLLFVAHPPLPDGSLALDRQHIAFSYNGITAEGAVVIPPPPDPVYSGFTGTSQSSLFWGQYIKNRRR